MRLIKIGRDASCTISYPNPRVSALHAEIIVLNNGDILLEDKGSSNGTTVNGKPITPGVSVNVRRGDRIVFGDQELQWSRIPDSEDVSSYNAIYGIGKHQLNDIRVDGARVSRFHATLKIGKDKKAYIEDHSKNGTTVNGNRIPGNQNYRIKRGDSVAVGGIPVALDDYLPKAMKWLTYVAAVCAIAVIGVAAYLLWPNKVGGADATALVYNRWHYVVKLVDDPFMKVIQDHGIEGYPEYFEIGMNDEGKLGLMGEWAALLGRNPNEFHPIEIQGTAFFVDKEGRMLTNRHVAMPWFYDEAQVKEIRAIIGACQQEALENPNFSSLILRIYMYSYKNYDRNQFNSWVTKFQASDMTIDGVSDKLAIGEPGKMYTSINEFLPTSLIADSKDKEIDVALMQLNSKETPKKAAENLIDLKTAVLDANSLKPGKEKFTFFGYPFGILLNLDNQEYGGLNPQIYEMNLARVPGKNYMELQGQVQGGASGSPILNNKGQFVGIISRAIDGTTISYGLLAKYAVKLYNQAVGITAE